jgi:hypothetical protein
MSDSHITGTGQPDSLYSYPTKNDAARGLLVETCQTLERVGVSYVIVGGWCPYLLAEHPTLTHPGTQDVDVLFEDEPEGVTRAARELLSSGWIPSAKHPFQLLQPRTVEGQQLMFNIDLLHPKEASSSQDMFNDILDLGVRDDYNVPETHRIKSISFPSAQIVFDEKLQQFEPVCGTDRHGVEISVTIPLLCGAATILSKCKSCTYEKRPRDAFDMYLLLSGARGAETSRALRGLANQFAQVNQQLGLLRAFLDNPNKAFDKNVSQYAPPDFLFPQLPSELVRAELFG